MKTLIVAVLLAAAPAVLAQNGERAPLPAEIQGTWEMVEAASPPGIEIVRLSLSIDGDLVTLHDAFRMNGEIVERQVTIECFDVDGVIGCLPSEDGTTGYGGLGAYTIDGDTLRLSSPGTDDAMILRRVDE